MLHQGAMIEKIKADNHNKRKKVEKDKDGIIKIIRINRIKKERVEQSDKKSEEMIGAYFIMIAGGDGEKYG